jgi:transcriptional regulator with XRE-family HTH domain
MRTNLLKMRLKKGLTQEALGRLIGVSGALISLLESGSTVGSVRVWDSLEDILGMSQQKLRKTKVLPQTSEPISG